MIVDIGAAEALLPLREQSRAETYKQGERVRAVIVKVLPITRNTRSFCREPIPTSRAAVRMEIPEIYDGTIVVRTHVHEPGDRAEVGGGIHRTERRPVGACVGMKGSRA